MTEAASIEPDRVPRSWSFFLPVGFLFLLSGGTALLYEVLWSRQLVLVLGGSYPAVVAVVTAFLAGLAGGAALGGRWAHRVEHPLKAYGILEAAIGLYCALFPVLLDLMHPVFGGLYRALGDSPTVHGAVRFLLAALLLMPPTLAMGATLPFLVRYVVRVRDGMVAGIGALYGLNTVGAAGGALVTGLWILPALGLKGTLAVGVVANLLIAVVAVLLDRARRGGAEKDTDGEPSPAVDEEPESATVLEPALIRSLLFLAAGSGFAAMVDQLGWTKALILFLGSSTHAFTLIVSAFILGLGLGGLLAPLVRTRVSRLPLVLAALQVVIGASAWYGLHRLIDLPIEFVEAMEGMRGQWSTVLAWEFGQVLAVVLLPTLAMGVTFPVLAAAVAGRVDRASGSVGRVYAWNTAGTILGSLVGGMILVPALGIRGALLVAVALNFGLAALVFATALPRIRGLAVAVGCLVAAGGLSLAAPEWAPHRLQSGPFAYWGNLHSRSRAENKPVDLVMRDQLWDTSYYKEGRTATVSVVRWTNGSVFLRVNGKT
ncbi:MAG: fused MFS/spermidine synthase, partial [Planctomycetota bacterium]